VAGRYKINKVIKILQGKEAILPGSLSRLTQKREKGGSCCYWYLTWKEGGASRAIYIPSQDVRRVARGIENMKRVKEVILKIAMDNLRKLRGGRYVRKRG
jgi:hypothetical protein